jgi:hypothetical protein
MTRLRLALPLVVAAAAFAAQGCGGDATTNGLERLSAPKVQQRAGAALTSAGSVHVRGSGATFDFDMRFDGSSSSGTFAAEGVKLAMTRIGDAFYVKAGRSALEKLGAAPPAARVGAGRWLKLGIGQITAWKGLSLAEIAAQLGKGDSPLKPEVEQATLAGKRVVILRHEDGSKLYVANTGVAYPLRADYNGRAPGRLDFTEFGSGAPITAPEHAVDVETLLNRGA